jgi:hypothetical protein
MQLEERRKEQAHARHVCAGNALVAIVDEKEDGAVESEAVEEFGGGTQGGGVGVERPAAVVSFPFSQAIHELHFHVVVVLRTFQLHGGKIRGETWGVRGGCSPTLLLWWLGSAKGKAHLHTVGNQEVPDGRIVDALRPLNAVVNVVDFDVYAKCLINGQCIEMQVGKVLSERCRCKTLRL